MLSNIQSINQHIILGSIVKGLRASCRRLYLDILGGCIYLHNSKMRYTVEPVKTRFVSIKNFLYDSLFKTLFKPAPVYSKFRSICSFPTIIIKYNFALKNLSNYWLPVWNCESLTLLIGSLGVLVQRCICMSYYHSLWKVFTHIRAN